MRNSTRAAAALLGAIVLTGITAVSATAAEAPGAELTVDVKGTPIAISAPDAGIDLGIVGTDATTQIGTIAGITVTDGRAGIVPWSASVSITDFTATGGVVDTEGAAAVIAASNFSYTAGDATNKSGGVTVTPTSTPIVGATAGAIVQVASDVSGSNTATWGATFALTIPAQALAGVYTATLTHSVL